jgi:hypothetical protein
VQENILAAIVRRDKAVAAFLVELQHPSRRQLPHLRLASRPTTHLAPRLTRRDHEDILHPRSARLGTCAKDAGPTTVACG